MTFFKAISANVLIVTTLGVTAIAASAQVIPVPPGHDLPMELTDPAFGNGNLSVDLGNQISIPGAQPSIDPGFGLPSGQGGAGPAPRQGGNSGAPSNGGDNGGGGAGANHIGRAVAADGSVQAFRVVCPEGTFPDTRAARDGNGLRWVCAYTDPQTR